MPKKAAAPSPPTAAPTAAAPVAPPAPPAAHLVWERDEPTSRAALAPLSRERIVRAAIVLADGEGLAAVSLRNVGAALDAGPMRLYGYITSKEELLDLMADAVYATMLSDDDPAIPTADWRGALRAMARRIRHAAERHPWFVDLIGGRPNLGPHGLAFTEASLAALGRAPGFGDINRVLATVRAVNAYVIGAIRGAANDWRAEQATGLDEAAWQQATWPYLQRMLATGRFPNIERVVQDVVHPTPDEQFEQGLTLLLDGVAKQLKR